MEVFQVLKKNPLKKKKKKLGVFKVFVTKRGGFCSKIAFFGEKKTPKVEDFVTLSTGGHVSIEFFFTSPGNHQKWRSL